MQRILTAVCAFTILATACLSVSVLVLRPPRADYRTWFPMAALFVAQSAITLADRERLRPAMVTGSGAIVAVGGWWAYRTLNGVHFEGYALVLGSVLLVQGALTIVNAKKGVGSP
jgi:hypothetical protein